MGLLFMCPIIVQPNANAYSYTSRKLTAANVSYTVQAWHTFMPA